MHQYQHVFLTGPYWLDVVSGAGDIGTVNVYPGTFSKMDFDFNLHSDSVYGNHSIVIGGNYVNAGGSTVHFILKSDFVKRIELPLANGEISVSQDSLIDIAVTFDLNSLLGNIDFRNATLLSNGDILIDKDNNAALLNQFELNLSKYIEIRHR